MHRSDLLLMGARTMKTFMRILAPAAVAAAIVFGAGGASAACIAKAGKGTGSTTENAKFQAWEAVLQATDWSSWASFMASGMKVGSAPGYAVSGIKSRCTPGGLGQECIVQAKLCK
jgi:hypothetical protein